MAVENIDCRFAGNNNLVFNYGFDLDTTDLEETIPQKQQGLDSIAKASGSGDIFSGAFFCFAADRMDLWSENIIHIEGEPLEHSGIWRNDQTLFIYSDIDSGLSTIAYRHQFPYGGYTNPASPLLVATVATNPNVPPGGSQYANNFGVYTSLGLIAWPSYNGSDVFYTVFLDEGQAAAFGCYTEEAGDGDRQLGMCRPAGNGVDQIVYPTVGLTAIRIKKFIPELSPAIGTSETVELIFDSHAIDPELVIFVQATDYGFLAKFSDDPYLLMEIKADGSEYRYFNILGDDEFNTGIATDANIGVFRVSGGFIATANMPDESTKIFFAPWAEINTPWAGTGKSTPVQKLGCTNYCLPLFN